MPKLNQIIAIEKGAKTRINDDITKVYHAVKKPEMMSGLSRSYQPKEDDGEKLPPESKLVQATASGMLAETARLMTELFDLTRTKDEANCHAKADVVLPNGTTLLKQVPIAHLLFLKKQMEDLRTIINSIPTLDPADRWAWDSNVNAQATAPVQTVKTKKVPKAFVKAPATKEHPAQVDVFQEDIVVGTWTVIKYSGALPAEKKALLLSRVDMLLAAVKAAKEEANSVDAPEKKEGETLFAFLLSDV